MHPGTDRAEMIVGLPLPVGVVGMDQTQNEEDMEQQIKTERRCRKGPERPNFVE